MKICGMSDKSDFSVMVSPTSILFKLERPDNWVLFATQIRLKPLSTNTLMINQQALVRRRGEFIEEVVGKIVP